MIFAFEFACLRFESFRLWVNGLHETDDVLGLVTTLKECTRSMALEFFLHWDYRGIWARMECPPSNCIVMEFLTRTGD